MSNQYIHTPFGNVHRHLIEKFKKLTGLIERDEQWVILQDRILGYIPSKDDRGRQKWQRGQKLLPVRYYNFQYAMAKSNGDINAAINYAENKLFSNGEPVYLPDLLAQKAGLYTEEPHFFYNKILDEVTKMARL